jgi:uncharacterized protein (TIGR04141 family)
MELEKKLTHLNIFLIKEAFNQSTDIINEADCNTPVEIQIPEAGRGMLYIKVSPDHLPKWSHIFDEYIDIVSIPKVSSASAAFLIKVDDRFFVLTFGQSGRFLIKEGTYEERFGLLVALNSVDKESLRCIDKQSLDTIQSHSRIQSGHETTADQFGIDIEQDMLKAIVGAPSDTRLGSRMTGTDSLSVSVRMNLSDLANILQEYKNKYNADLSSTDYQWVNNISIVKNTSIIEMLESMLIEKLIKNDHTNLWLSIPEIIQWDLVKGFTYSEGKGIVYPDINLPGFLSTVSDDILITQDLLKHRKVSCVDEDHKKVFRAWPIYKCLYSELDYDGSKYIINDGKWFNINTDFVNKTNSEFAKIVASSLSLPEYCGGGEGIYNRSVADAYPSRFALLDDKNKIFHGGGHGQIEVCDLLSIDKQLIHVKVYGKSTVFSHLISQGFVSGQLLQLDAEFRKKVKAKLSLPFKDLFKEESRPMEKEFTIIFAIISDSKEEGIYLPFFSRVNLNNATKTLKGFGYNLELLKIKVNDRFARTTILPSKKNKERQIYLR